MKNLRLLLVEYDSYVRDYLCTFFQNQGCQVTAFDNAEHALDSLKRQNCDAIICDYKLPGMDGLDFFRKVRWSHPYVIRILMTEYGEAKVFTEALEAGIHELVKRPFMTATSAGASPSAESEGSAFEIRGYAVRPDV